MKGETEAGIHERRLPKSDICLEKGCVKIEMAFYLTHPLLSDASSDLQQAHEKVQHTRSDSRSLFPSLQYSLKRV